MKLKYDSPKVERFFGDFGLMQRRIGDILTRNTKKRCDQLKAAPNFSTYLSTGLGKPHRLFGNLQGCYGINISGNIRLVIRPEIESLDPDLLKECDTIIIKGVLDYHGRKHEWLIP